MKKKKFGTVKGFIVPLLLLTCFGNVSNAQVTVEDVLIESCFQSFFANGEEKNVLSGSKLKVNFFEGRPKDALVEIKLFDENGGVLLNNYDGFLGEGFNLGTVYAENSDGEIVEVNGVTLWNGEHFNNGEISIPPDVKKIEIRIASFEGSTQLHSLGLTTTLNVLETHEAFELVNDGDECFTFDDFRPDVLTNLDGFCGNLSAKIQSNPNAIEPNYDWSIDLSVANNISDRKDCATACENVIASATLSDPVPCGCEIIKMEVTLEPCVLPGKELCPEISMIMGAEVCCKCDVREFDNSQN